MLNKKVTGLIAVIVAVIMLVPLQVLIQPANAQADEPWPLWRHDAVNSGVAPGPGPKYLSDPPKWTFKTGAPIFGSVSAAYGNVYFGSQDQTWYCLNAETGALKWSLKTNWLIRSSPALANNRVYLGPDDGVIRCLNAQDGTAVWTRNVDGGLIKGFFDVNPFQIRSSPIIVGNRLYVGSLDANVYCLNIADGSVVWKTKTGKAICSSAAVTDGKVWIGSGDRNMYCLNASNGAVLWKFNTNADEFAKDPGFRYPTVGTGEVCSSPTIADGKCFFFSSIGAVYFALDANTGKEVWRLVSRRQRYNYQDTTSPPEPLGMRTVPITYCTPCYHDGNLYISDDYFEMRVNAKDGIPYWEPFSGMNDPNYSDFTNVWQNGKGVFSYWLSVGFITQSSYTYADGKVYVGGFQGSVYCNDAITGERYSWYETGGFAAGSPTVAYGKVYEGSIDTEMYCFQEGTRDPQESRPLSQPH